MSQTVERPRPLRVFLCYSSGDKAAVRDLYRRLLTDGFEPWLEEESLLPGQDWREEIPKAVRRSDAVIVCLSRGSINEEGYVQKEIRYALDFADEKPEGTIFIIPLKLEECDVPSRLSQWQCAGLFEPGGYDRLCRALRERARTGQAAVSAGRERAPYKAGWKAKVALTSIVIALTVAGFAWLVERPANQSPQTGTVQANTAKTKGPKLRSEPATLSAGQVKAMLALRDFYSTNWNDGGRGILHSYQTRVIGDAVVIADAATGLMWQKGGSGDTIPAEDAQKYIRSLNDRKFGGFTGWRLPTLEEAMSLMTTNEEGVPDQAMLGDERVKGVMHLDRGFDKQAAPFVWTSDPAPEKRRWIVYYWDGECSTESANFNSYVRAVRSM